MKMQKKRTTHLVRTLTLAALGLAFGFGAGRIAFADLGQLGIKDPKCPASCGLDGHSCNTGSGCHVQAPMTCDCSAIEGDCSCIPAPT